MVLCNYIVVKTAFCVIIFKSDFNLFILFMLLFADRTSMFNEVCSCRSNARHGGGTIIPHLNFSIPCAALLPIFKFSKGYLAIIVWFSLSSFLTE